MDWAEKVGARRRDRGWDDEAAESGATPKHQWDEEATVSGSKHCPSLPTRSGT